MIKLKLKDGSIMEVEKGTKILDVAKEISEGLARVATCGEINGEVKDLRYEICIPLFSEILQYLILSAFDKLIKSSNEHAFLTVMHDNWL